MCLPNVYLQRRCTSRSPGREEPSSFGETQLWDLAYPTFPLLDCGGNWWFEGKDISHAQRLLPRAPLKTSWIRLLKPFATVFVSLLNEAIYPIHFPSGRYEIYLKVVDC